MDCEQKYQKALSRAKYYHDRDNIQFLENIFPELRESEDEKWIPKEIAKYLKEKGDFRSCWIAWLEKQGERKPSDKVEPKFRNGQWIVWQGKCYKVNYNGCGYELVDQNGLSTSLEYETIDENAHLWDITKDAKDGDVLCGYPTDNYPWIGIFHELNGDYTFKSYCYLQAGITGKFCPPSGVNIFNRRNVDENNSIIMVPATKEQCDLLFQKMKEAGYEWDAEKKELRKIEQKPAWSEEDKSHIGRILSYLESFKAYNTPRVEPIKKEIDWLKSLKPQSNLYDKGYNNGYSAAKFNHWKPSEEQMIALRWVLNNIPYNKHKEVISQMVEQLKKF